MTTPQTTHPAWGLVLPCYVVATLTTLIFVFFFSAPWWTALIPTWIVGLAFVIGVINFALDSDD